MGHNVNYWVTSLTVQLLQSPFFNGFVFVHLCRFMICCDHCEDWFHGMCVGITMAQGRQMEKDGQEYVCPKCQGELELWRET